MILKVKNENGQFKEVVLKGLKGDKGDRGEDGTVLQQKEIDGIKSSLDNIMNEFNEHITNHPSGDIDNIINSLEPSNNDIPKVFFNGDITDMSGDNEKKIRIRYSSKTLQ